MITLYEEEDRVIILKEDCTLMYGGCAMILLPGEFEDYQEPFEIIIRWKAK